MIQSRAQRSFRPARVISKSRAARVDTAWQSPGLRRKRPSDARFKAQAQAKVMPRCNSPWSQENLPWSGELAEEVACAANVEARFIELRECVPRPASYKGGCAHVPGGIHADVLCGEEC